MIIVRALLYTITLLFIVHCLLLFVVVCCHPIYSGRQNTPFRIVCGRSSRGHTGGRPHGSFFPPPPFCGALSNFLPRKGFSRPFHSSTVKSNFVYPRHIIIVLSTCWAWCEEKSSYYSATATKIQTHVPNVIRRFRGYPLNLLGDHY